jgi:probable rRNA maturation factor
MKYLVNVYNKQRLVKIADLKIKEIISYVLEDELAPRTMGMNIMLVRDPVIRRYHRDFMGIDTPTDCISFPPEDLKEANVLEPACGDVVLSVDHALAYALQNDVLFPEEIVRYAIHGTLHCLGYDDLDSKSRRSMFAKQEKYIAVWHSNFYTTK